MTAQLCSTDEELSNFTELLYEEKTICLIAEYKKEEEDVWYLSCNRNSVRRSAFPDCCWLLVAFMPDLSQRVSVQSQGTESCCSCRRFTSFCNWVPARTNRAD